MADQAIELGNDKDFDWVTELFSCTPFKVFEKLKLQVERDVKTRNEMFSKEARYHFSTEADGRDLLVLSQSDASQESVKFSLTNDGIAVHKKNETLKVVLTLNDKGQCRPKINGKECEFWQLRMMALEDLFRV